MLKKIEKTISRDLPLVNIFAWHKGFTIGMKKWLGWSYSDVVFYVHDGYSDIMRLPEEHLRIFKELVLNKIDNEPNWFNEEYDKFIELTDEIYKSFDGCKKSKKISNNELILNYSNYIKYIESIMGLYVVMIYLPIWCENNKKLMAKYNKVINLSIQGRKKSEQIFPRGDKLVNNILDYIRNKTKFSKELLHFLSKDELFDFLANDKKLNESKLKERRKGFIFCKKGIILINDKPIKKVFADLGYDYQTVDNLNLKELKGSVACKGIVKGKVKVIMSKKKISSIKINEILVASMTTPEYLPAMKKAVAFVTDEGGITCHAAIVARELNKPCIIGTKIATQVLRDNDLVEVDADRGIVTIIKKAK
ncbi:hypothetical protein KAR28_06890 [Candidatus Parcubacteria bacterium]|nr:hypothetical protein [Candidatus Parcubacteria bacterium]